MKTENISDYQILIRNLIASFKEFSSGVGEQKALYEECFKKLNDTVGKGFADEKLANVIDVINKVIDSLKKHRNLISKNHCMTIPNFVLNKIWQDIIYAAVSSSGYGRPNLYHYTNATLAGEDRINDELLLKALEELSIKAKASSSYSDLVICLAKEQQNFLNLDI